MDQPQKTHRPPFPLLVYTLACIFTSNIDCIEVLNPRPPILARFFNSLNADNITRVYESAL